MLSDWRFKLISCVQKTFLMNLCEAKWQLVKKKRQSIFIMNTERGERLSHVIVGMNTNKLEKVFKLV